MLSIENLSFRYAAGPILENLTLALPAGGHLSLIGESGCGKSTLLKLIYGILVPSTGQILIDGVEVPNPKNALLPGMPGVKYLAQDFGLMPYATVAENVGRDLSNANKALKRNRVRQVLELVGIDALADEKPHKISGGQQQRTALAMVLASRPKLLLLDEPFSQVDAFHTAQLRRDIFNYCLENGVSCVVATHDAADVMPFATSVLVMRLGLSPKLSTPSELINNPPDLYAASLLGEASSLPAGFIGLNNPVERILFPHQMTIGQGTIDAVVLKSYYRGTDYLVEANASGTKLFISHNQLLAPGSRIKISVQ